MYVNNNWRSLIKAELGADQIPVATQNVSIYR